MKFSIKQKSVYLKIFRVLYQRIFLKIVVYLATNFLRSTIGWMELTRMDHFAKDMSYSALIGIQTGSQLIKLHLLPFETNQIHSTLETISIEGSVLPGLCPSNPHDECLQRNFRSASGFCNNVKQPLWGASYEAMQRLLPAVYDDGISQSRRSVIANNEMPSTRLISRKILSSKSRGNSADCSLMLAQWAQFVYEDMVRIGSNRLFDGI